MAPTIEEIDDADYDIPEFGGDVPGSGEILPLEQQKISSVPVNAPTSGRPVYVADTKEFSGWQCIYPIYFDRKRSIAAGRRLGVEMCVDNPLARNIAGACNILGLKTMFEPEKTHPQDWANPGRVRVWLKDHGRATSKYNNSRRN